MRNIFIEELINFTKKNKKVVLLVNDLGYSVVEKFAKLYPKQFYNAGVAEQNMMGIAAGMALEGHHVFVYSLGNFPTFRCAEQIRNDIDYHNLPVTIVNVGAGISYGNLGYSHHSIQDFGLMRLFSNFLIASPGDEYETKNVVNHLLKNPKPSYLRLAKSNNIKIHKKLIKTEEGKWLPIKINKKSNFTFLSTGITSYLTKDLLNKPEFKNYSHYSLPLWGSNLKKKQINQVKKWKKIIILEDHLEDGGFGSWMRESLANNNVNCKIITWSLKKDVIGKVGNQNYLLKKYLK